MPSLPELEVYKALLSGSIIGRSVTAVEPLDWRVVRVDLEQLKPKLIGQAFTAIDRYGKWLILSFGWPEQLLIHLGLTGKLQVINPADELPKYSVFTFTFDDDRRLVLSDQRKLGRLYLRKFADIKAEKSLGPDLLTLNEDSFIQTVRRKRRGVRDVLMDQKIIAGIGGKYADEILWQAKLHPNTKLDRLSEAQVRELFRLAQSINRTAIELGGDADHFPSNWLIPHRRTDKHCPRCGSPLAERNLGGSETFYCPKDQPVPMPFRSG